MTDDLPSSDVQTPPARPWSRRLAACTSILFLIGLCLRLTLRDRLPYLATLYYAMPLPVLVVLSFLTVVCFRRLRRYAAASIWTLTTAFALIWCVAATTYWSTPADGAGEPIRILCWNISSGHLGWERVAAQIQELQPDIAGIVESGYWSEKREEFWVQAFPDYQVWNLGGGFLCLTKGPVGEATSVRLPRNGQYRRLKIGTSTQPLTLLIVDVESDPLQSRRETLEQLAADANQLSDRPVVILGDFNTPADSVHFSDLREQHRHGFETSGAGYIATWPLPLPVLCLDHIWGNRHVRFDRCVHAWTTASDHRPVIADITIAQ